MSKSDKHKFQNWDKKELSELAKRAQKKSVEARRANTENRKKAVAIAEELLTKTLRRGKVNDISKLKTLEDVNDGNVDALTRLVFAQIYKSMKGDTRSAEFILRLVGEFPVEALQVTHKTDNPLEGLTTEQLIKLAESGDDKESDSDTSEV
ncbi:MAG: hypothetical protein J6X38_08535 [Abditibacteriota bacterium]|nr:hypothetical protein [Abditibacteriota bacterium]